MSKIKHFKVAKKQHKVHESLMSTTKWNQAKKKHWKDHNIGWVGSTISGKKKVGKLKALKAVIWEGRIMNIKKCAGWMTKFWVSNTMMICQSWVTSTSMLRPQWAEFHWVLNARARVCHLSMQSYSIVLKSKLFAHQSCCPRTSRPD